MNIHAAGIEESHERVHAHVRGAFSVAETQPLHAVVQGCNSAVCGSFMGTQESCPFMDTSRGVLTTLRSGCGEGHASEISRLISRQGEVLYQQVAM